MLFSKSFTFTTRENPKIAECESHRFLLKGCFLFMVASGIYSYLPLGMRVLQKISTIVRRHLNAQGAQELFMSALQPIEMWEKTGRDKTLKDVMFTFKDRKERLMCLGPTHEEEITEIVRKYVVSYKQMPFILYQIQTKFRDEPRPRYGLMRGCEFIMKDAYSFDVNKDGLDESYSKMLSAYQKIFAECGLNFVVVEADSGVMGGDVSHEFMVPAEIGEDFISYCENCKKYFAKKSICPDCGKNAEEKRAIEMGHVFKLGTKYSLAQEALFLDKDGERKPIIMGCYGIGVSRMLAAIAEQNCDSKGILWPKTVSPFDISFVLLDMSLLDKALAIKELLENAGFDVLLDERNEAAGVKFNDAYLIGNPYIVIMGKNYVHSQKLDLEIRRSGKKESYTQEELIKFLQAEYGR